MNPILGQKKKTRIKSAQYSERGQAIIMIVFSIIGLIGMIALAVDGGNAFLQKRDAQNAADTVALDAALARLKGSQTAWVDQAYGVAKSNGYDRESLTKNAQIYSPPISGRYKGDIEYIQVLTTYHVPTYFGGMIGIRQITVTGEAISRTKDSELAQILGGDALISLAPTSDCQNKRSFWIHGESTLNISGGGIFINSNNPDCALTQNGNGSIRIDGGTIKTVGGTDIQKPQLITPFPPETGAVPIMYPPPFMLPKANCSKPAAIQSDKVTISSGYWDEGGTFPPDGIQYMQAGIYCITSADFVIKGDSSLTGHDVVIVVENGQVRLDGENSVDLRAPDHGDLAGLLFYMPIDNHSLMVLSVGDKASVSGTILAPGAEIRINRNDSRFGFHSQIIGYTIRSDGQSNIVIQYNNNENLDVYSMPQIQLVK